MTLVIRVTSVVALAVVVTVLSSSVALADPDLGRGGGGSDNQDGGYEFVVTDAQPGDVEGYVPVAGGREPLDSFPYRRVTTDPATGEDCTRTRYLLIYAEEERGAAADTVRLEERRYEVESGGDAPPACSGLVVDPGAPAERAAALVAGELAPASPSVQPDNRAVTGMRSYLRTNIDSSWSEVRSVSLFGRDWDVRVDVEGVHTVDWGDGTVVAGVTGDGGPWHAGAPVEGDISHAYVDTGDMPLVVATDWSVTATLLVNDQTRSQSVTTTSDPVVIDVTEVRSRRDR